MELTFPFGAAFSGHPQRKKQRLFQFLESKKKLFFRCPFPSLLQNCRIGEYFIAEWNNQLTNRNRTKRKSREIQSTNNNNWKNTKLAEELLSSTDGAAAEKERRPGMTWVDMGLPDIGLLEDFWDLKVREVRDVSYRLLRLLRIGKSTWTIACPRHPERVKIPPTPEKNIKNHE